MTESGVNTTSFLDLYGERFHADPYGELARLRERDWHTATVIGTGVLRYAEVQAVLSMRELRTAGADFLAMQGITDGLLVDTMRGFLLNADGESHDRVRRMVGNTFTVRRVGNFRPVVRAIVDQLVDGMAATDECDFVTAFADPLALRVLYEFLGVPESVHTDVQRWAADVSLIFGLSVVEHRGRIESALRNLHRFLDELLELRRIAPRDDLLSALLVAEENGQRLTDAELRAMVVTLLSAGQATVRRQLGNAMAAFLSHPDQWRLLGARPALGVGAAEEVLRYCPSVLLGIPRIVKTDIELNGRVFAAGSWVLPITGSANRDERVFSAPETMDISRSYATHLTFGGGAHYCLGAALARVELQEALPRLASTIAEPRAAGPAEWLPPTEAVYGPLRLPIRYRVTQRVNGE